MLSSLETCPPFSCQLIHLDVSTVRRCGYSNGDTIVLAGSVVSILWYALRGVWNLIFPNISFGQLNQVEEYMRYRKVPQDLRQRVQEFYEHRYRKKYFNEAAILNELSKGLREVMWEQWHCLLSFVKYEQVLVIVKCSLIPISVITWIRVRFGNNCMSNIMGKVIARAMVSAI